MRISELEEYTGVIPLDSYLPANISGVTKKVNLSNLKGTYDKISSSTYFQNTTLVPTIISEMSITPAIAGK